MEKENRVLFSVLMFLATHMSDTICSAHMIMPLKKNGKFFNNNTETSYTHLTDALKIFWATKTSFQKYYPADHASWIKKDTPLTSSIPLHIQWIGHASFLIQVNDFNILTDPVFFDLNPLLYPRKTPVGIEPSCLPHIDMVLISHNHRDHLDQASMKVLKAHQPIMLVPDGTKKWFLTRGFKQVIEHTWWQKEILTKNGRSIECTFVPAVHWSGRGALDAHTSLWGGWIIRAQEKTVYFAGDTGFSEPIFKAIAKYVGNTIDCALLPIGPCEPRALMCHSHMGPQEVVQAFDILKPKWLIPMHWGTFGLGPDCFDAPIKRLNSAWATIDPTKQSALYKIKFGQRVSIV